MLRRNLGGWEVQVLPRPGRGGLSVPNCLGELLKSRFGLVGGGRSGTVVFTGERVSICDGEKVLEWMVVMLPNNGNGFGATGLDT